MSRGNRVRGEAAHDVLAAEAFEVPAPDPALHEDPPHDVLAADEYGMPAADPALHEDPPHDVLATDEFEIPGADPDLLAVHQYVPADPSGRPEPHDVLAADEFPMPAVRPHVAGERSRGGAVPRWAVVAAGVAVAVRVARRARRAR